MIVINNKELKKPLFQGGMGIGVSLGNLAGAVAKEGAAGTISAAQIGFKEPDFEKNPFEANLRAVEKEMKKARKIAPDGIIGFNIMAAINHYEEYVEAAVKAGADFLVCGAGLPMDLPAIVKRTESENYPALIPVLSTERAARVLFRSWERRYKCVPDLVLAEGPMAGGHLGFSKEQLDVYNEEKALTKLDESMGSYKDEVKKIIALCREYEEKFKKRIPVILAGGISTNKQAREAFLLGADAIQAASRFVTSYECDASDSFKQAYLNADKKDIILVKSPVGLWGRAVRNTFTDKVMSGERVAPIRCKGCLKKCKPNETIYCISEALIRAVSEDSDSGLVFCGSETHRLDHLEYTKEIIESLLS